MGRVEDAIGALKLEYPTLDFSYRDFPLGEPGEKMFTWPGPPDEDVMIVVHQCSGVRELFHRHDFFYFNYTYCGSYDSLSQRYDNVRASCTPASRSRVTPCSCTTTRTPPSSACS